MIFVNFKTSKQGTGEEAVKLAKICAEVEKETSVKIIPIVQAADVARIANLGIKVWSQAILAPQAAGVLLNHSDYKLAIEAIGKEVRRIRNSELRIMICVESVEDGKKIAEFKPDFLAYEPPELIGGEVSVSSAKPAVISEFVQKIIGIPILVGAGIHNQVDVKKALDLGAVGILVSHAVVEAEDPKKVLLELAKGFKNEKI